MYTYSARITNVVDGDTVDAEIDLGFDLKLNDRVRLYGIDTPETRTKDLNEKAAGYEAKEFLINQLEKYDYNVIIQTVFNKRGKYDRILGTIFSPDMLCNINELLITEGHAKKYVI